MSAASATPWPWAWTGASPATLAGKEVHLWHIDLDDARWDSLAGVLAPAEQSKSMLFRSQTLQSRWRRCRGALRLVLASYTGEAPEALTLVAGQHGKLTLPGTPVHFNVSHTERRALVAVAGEPVGIDLEPVDRPGIVVDDIADIICHPSERAVLRTLSGAAAGTALLRLWTQKEAYVKALGTGLQHSLTAVRFVADGRDNRLCVVDESEDAIGNYYIHALEAPPDCHTSLCTSTRELTCRHRW